MYIANDKRYDEMKYRRCGKSGIKLPMISLGLWHNFGSQSIFDNSRQMLLGAFDLGITHIDLANNYGPVPGSAEETFGKVMEKDLHTHRDEIIVSTKAGYHMWEGPYGEWGSKKSLVASLDQSLKRMKLDYVDIFYHHRPDPETPLEETLEAFRYILNSGKALYVGISNYNSEQTEKALSMLSKMKIHCLIHQMRYSLLDTSNKDVLDVLEKYGVGGIAFSPLCQGILTGKYLNGIPEDSRANGHSAFLTKDKLTDDRLDKTRKLQKLAIDRGQSLSQMALAWVLNQKQLSSVIIGARNVEQIKDNVRALDNLSFSEEENSLINSIIA